MKQNVFCPLLVAWFFIFTSSNAFAIDQWPDTGQTTCYDSAGGEVNCDGSEGFVGQDGAYDGPVRSYDTTTQPGTVIDNVTMLQWYNPSPADKDLLDYDQAQAYVDNLNTGNYNDWRIPTIQELATIIDASLQAWDIDKQILYGPFVMPDGAETGLGGNDAIYWSSTPSPQSTSDPKGQMVVRFLQGLVNDGDVSGHPFGNVAYVRPVRDLTPDDTDPKRFVDNEDATVSDNLTGLMWQQATATTTAGQLFTWGGTGTCEAGGANAQGDVLCYCENLILAGHDDWRLPNRNELQSLVDYFAYDSGRALLIDQKFPDDDRDDLSKIPYYWSSTTGSSWDEIFKVFIYDSAVAIRFDRGFSLVDIEKTGTHYVRCVRGVDTGNIFIFMPAILNGALK